MPIHLPSLQRRTFLKTSLGAGVSLLTFNTMSAAETAAEAEGESEHVALIADTHIDADATRVVRGSVMASNLLRVVADILTLKQKPVFALINGDCAFNVGLPADYKTFASLVSGITAANIPLHMAMGNHDDRFAFLAQFDAPETAGAAVEGKHVTLVQTRHANWFVIDTLWQVNNVTGEVGAEQLRWLKSALETNSDKPAIVVGHHNPQFMPDNGRISGILDSQPLFDILESLSHVKAYVFGHTHNWNMTQRDSGLHLINLPPVGYVFDEKRPAGWVDAEVHGSGLSLTLHSLDVMHPEHMQAQQLSWR